MMARNGIKKGSKSVSQTKHPQQIFERLELSKQIACYSYWRHLVTGGTEGWDTERAGLVYHYRESNYLQNNIKTKSWSNIGKVSHYECVWEEEDTGNRVVACFCLRVVCCSDTNTIVKTVATLARDLQSRGINLIDPFEEHQKQLGILEKKQRKQQQQQQYQIMTILKKKALATTKKILNVTPAKKKQKCPKNIQLMTHSVPNLLL